MQLRYRRGIVALLGALAVALIGLVVPGIASPAGASTNPAFSIFDLPNPPAPPGSPIVALTFDDGPSAQITPAILDTLAANGATATFFVVGQWVNQHPELVRRAVALGNSVQVHTMSHPHLDHLSAAQIDAEIDPEIAILTDLTGRRPTCMRPPYGAYNATVINEASSRGLATIIWNVNPGDTEAGSTASSIAARALAGARSGAVIAMHDAATKASTLAALPTILSGLRARGLLTVPICGGGVPFRDVAVRADGRSGYRLDANGALQPFGGAPSIAESIALPGIARRVALRADGQSGYVLDGFGGIHSFGGAPAATGGTAYWPHWDIARGLALRPDGHSGWVLDGFGGVHPWGGAPAVSQPAYWSGWDIARAAVATSDGGGGYVLDGLGGIHAFGTAKPVTNGPYWPGQDRARSFTLGYDNSSGWVLDANGDLLPFGRAANGRPSRLFGGDGARGVALGADGVSGEVVDGGGTLAPFTAGPLVRAVGLRADGTSGYTLDASGQLRAFGGAPAAGGAPSWPNWDIARDVALRGDGSGYVLDGLGGLHPVNGAPGLTGPSFPRDLARAVHLRSDGTSGYVLDAFGALHPFGGAPAISDTPYWPGFDIARAFTLRPDGISGWVLDGFGGLHAFGGAPAITNGPYWSGWDIARGVIAATDGISGWVLDGLGGLHAFGAATPRSISTYAGHPVMQDVESAPADHVVVVDSYGHTHRA